MHAIIILSGVIAGVVGGYAGSTSNAGNGVDSTGYGYGYSGTGQGGVPNFPPFDFNNFLSSYIENLRNHQEQLQSHANTYAYTTGNANSNVQAQSSLVFDNTRNPGFQFQPSLQAAHRNAMSGFGFPSGFPGAYGGGNYGAGGGAFGGSFSGGDSSADSADYGANLGGAGVPYSGGAVATGSIGPEGGFQGAAVFPENPEHPNIFTRFGGGNGEAQPAGDGKFFGISVSSHSQSNDDNGHKTSMHEAETSINDNGKITTYKVKNP